MDTRIIKKSFERKQKVAAIALCIMLAGVFYSCSKKVEASDNVPFELCPCEEEKPKWVPQLLPRGEAFLFKDNIPEQMLDIVRSANKIIYETEVQKVSFYGRIDGHEISFVSKVCNFPDFAKEWAIQENGCKVVFEGIMYETCSGGGTAAHFSFDYVLTNIKRIKI